MFSKSGPNCRTLPDKPVRLYVNREDQHLGHLEARAGDTKTILHFAPYDLTAHCRCTATTMPLCLHGKHPKGCRSCCLRSLKHVLFQVGSSIFPRRKVGLLFKICELLTSHGVDICNQLSMPMVMFDALKDWCQF